LNKLKQYLIAVQTGLGLDIDSMVYGDLDNDAELEAELRALQEEDARVYSGRKQGGTGGGRGCSMTQFYL